MSREVKVGILAIVAIFCAIWGYKFVKGQNLFKSTNSFYTTFNDVTALSASSPVLLNGFKIGQVTAIKLNPKNVKQMDVFFNIDGDIPLPKDAKVVMKSEGLVGGKLLTIEFSETCSGSNCASSGDFLQGQVLGLLGSMVGADEVNDYVSEATMGFQEIIKTLGEEGSEGKLHDIIRNLDLTVAKIAELSVATTGLINSSQQSINNTLRNMDAISKNIANSNEDITKILANVDKLTEELSSADFKGTVGKTNKMIDQTSMTMEDLNKTIASMDKTINNLNSLTGKMNDGQGTMGKLMNDKSLYENLDETSKNLSLLLQDLRLNPKRYVNVSVFGKKQKEYKLPEEDPALNK